MQSNLTIHHCQTIRMVGEGEFYLLIIIFDRVNIEVIPLRIACFVGRTLVPIKLNSILTSQDIYTNSDIDIQLVEATQHRDGGRWNRLFEDTDLERMRIGIEIAVLLATAEDIKLHACLFAQIVVDTNRFNLTVLQWSQIYMIPTCFYVR